MFINSQEFKFYCTFFLFALLSSLPIAFLFYLNITLPIPEANFLTLFFRQYHFTPHYSGF